MQSLAKQGEDCFFFQAFCLRIHALCTDISPLIYIPFWMLKHWIPPHTVLLKAKVSHTSEFQQHRRGRTLRTLRSRLTWPAVKRFYGEEGKYSYVGNDCKKVWQVNRTEHGLQSMSNEVRSAWYEFHVWLCKNLRSEEEKHAECLTTTTLAEKIWSVLMQVTTSYHQCSSEIPHHRPVEPSYIYHAPWPEVLPILLQ